MEPYETVIADIKAALREFASGYHDDQISTKLAIVEVPHMILSCVLSSKLAYAQQIGVHLTIDSFEKDLAAIDWQIKWHWPQTGRGLCQQAQVYPLLQKSR